MEKTTGAAYIILTDNYYLFAGLRASSIDITCYQVNYSGMCADEFPSANTGMHQIIIIDGNIFKVGNWKGYKDLCHKYPFARRIWLSLSNEWCMWPSGCSCDKQISIKLDVLSFSRCLNKIVQMKEEVDFNVHSPVLSKRETQIFSRLFRSSNVNSVARSMGRSSKLIYGYRAQVMHKFGFHSPAMMNWTYWHNLEIFDNSWLHGLHKLKCKCYECQFTVTGRMKPHRT